MKFIIATFRHIFGVPRPTISKAEAMEIAQTHCQKQNWAWLEPVSIREGLRMFTVRTNVGCKGGNVIIEVHAVTGEVLRAYHVPY